MSSLKTHTCPSMAYTVTSGAGRKWSKGSHLPAPFLLLLLPSLLFMCAFPPFAAGVVQRVKLAGSGATTATELMAALTRTFNRQRNASVVYRPVGSGEGRREFIASVTTFCATDVPLNAAEEAQMAPYPKLTLPLALQTVAVFTTIPRGPALRLSPAVLAGIFQRTIRTWDDPRIRQLNPTFRTAKAGQPIYPVVRKDKSGSTELFAGYMAKFAGAAWKLGVSGLLNWPAGVTRAPLTDGVARAMKARPYSIGYAGTGVGLAKGLSEVQLLNQARRYVRSSQGDVLAAIPTNLPASDRPWYSISLLGVRGPNTWPITSFLYVLARKDQVQVGQQGPLLVKWLRWLFSANVQAQLPTFYFYSLPANIVQKNLAAINTILVAPF